MAGGMKKHGGMQTSGGVDTSSPVNVLTATMKDLQSGSTMAAYQLASHAERMRIAAPGGHNHHLFRMMMHHEIYKPLISGYGYKVHRHGPHPLDEKNKYMAEVMVHTSKDMKDPAKFRFEMSLQHSDVVDTHDSLGPYKLHPGHFPVWRTDGIYLIKMKECPKTDDMPMMPTA